MENQAYYGIRRIALVGSPNVGKSLLFQRLTGAYVTVSNYPGTTVELARGRGAVEGMDCEIWDTPGIYSLLPASEEEEVTRRLFFAQPFDLVLHVVEARNLERMLPLTLQLIAGRLPLILVVNMLDEAERLGVEVDIEKLGATLGVPTVGTVCTTGEGIEELRERMGEVLRAGRLWDGRSRDAQYGRPASGVVEQPGVAEQYGRLAGSALCEIAEQIRGKYALGPVLLARLYLAGDEEVEELFRRREGFRAEDLFRQIRERLAAEQDRSLHYLLTVKERNRSRQIVGEAVREREGQRERMREVLEELTVNPVSGFVILLFILYFGLYRFVGLIGAGVIVDFMDEAVFGQLVNPFVENMVGRLVPGPLLRELFAGEYGILTLGFRYAIAIILPVVGAFFFVFSLLEDSGYLPRLAFLADWIFKKLGLNGRAVIPIVLGLGCDTMATITTRILGTRRERMIATFLLALAVPCSAQLGVIMALLAPHRWAVVFWGLFVFTVFFLSGFLAQAALPGSKPEFYMEIPPLRWPKLSNVLAKTLSRMRWYLVEILPVFILASLLIWVGRITGLFRLLLSLLQPLMLRLGLPEVTAVSILFGFFRRDYGAAGLYDLVQAGLLDIRQLAVAAVTLTLFVPCIAQLTVMYRERGLLYTLFVVALIFPLAFASGFLVNALFSVLQLV